MDSLFENALKKIIQNKQIKETGGYNCIPFPFDRLNNYVPGIIKGVQYIITANSGVGKTQLAKYLFVNTPYKFVKEHPESGIKLKILYFALEESKEEFMYTLISNRLKEVYNISISVNRLQSFNGDALTNDEINKIANCKDYFKELGESLEVIDGISNPTGIYKYVRNYSRQNGTHYYYNYKTDKDKLNPITETEYLKLENNNNYAYSHYTPHNENEYVIVICDHLSLLQTENGTASLHEAMTKMSAEYARKQITKHFKYIFVGVQQQSADKEKLQFTNAGANIEQKLEPSLDALGDNKLTQRDALVVFGLFAPIRYGIKHHLGYNLDKLGDSFRSLIILKNRVGRPNLRLPLYFDGETNRFEELPKTMTQNDYEKYT